MCIERTFGQLKGRWHILGQLCKFIDLKTVNHIIYVCCILHNLRVRGHDEFPILSAEKNLDDTPEIAEDPGVDVGDIIAQERLIEGKRYRLVKHIFNVNQL